MDIILFT